MVTNAELFKLITDFKADVTSKWEANDESNKLLAEKIDGFGNRLDRLDQRLHHIDENLLVHDRRLEEMDKKIAVVDSKVSEKVTNATDRIAKLERHLQHLEQVEFPEAIRKLQMENESLKEALESRTNRQLRRTLIFKNVPERKDDESYAEVKTLLAEIISTNTDITNEEALAGIERAHREAKRDGSSREGKRKIYVAFLNWELPQQILDEFRKKNIADRSFKIYVDQMYGPMTTQRRNMAFEMRKSLKEAGSIVSGFVNFPAKLMVNFPGDVDRNGRKIYREHKNFSDEKVERR